MLTLALYVLVTLLAVSVVVVRPLNALVIIYCLFAFEQLAQYNQAILLRYSWVTNVIGGFVILIALIVHMARSSKPLRTYTTVGWLVIILYFYAFMSLAWTPDFEQATSLWAAKSPYLVISLLITPLFVAEKTDMAAALSNTLVVGAAICALLLFTTEWESRRIVLSAGQRAALGNPLEVATLAGMVVVIGLLSSNYTTVSMKSVLNWALVIVSVVAIVKSGTRGQLIASFIVALAFLFSGREIRKSKKILYVVIVAIVLAGSTGYALQEYWIEHDRWYEDRIQADYENRIEMAGKLISKWLDTPLTIMFGLGNSAAYDKQIVGFYPHIVPLEILAEQGIVGFSLMMAILVLTVRQYLGIARIGKREKSIDKEAHILMALFCYFLLLSLKQGSLLGSYLLFMTASVLSEYARAMQRFRYEKRPK